MLRTFFYLTIIVLPILLPLNFIHGRDASNGVEGLDLFSWANVPSNHSQYYWAQLCLLLVVVTVFCSEIYREMQAYLSMRQDHLKSALLAGKSCKTVLVTDIPTDLRSIEKLRAIYERLTANDVPTIWINRDARQLIAKIRRRQDISMILEKAETRLIQLCLKTSKHHYGERLRQHIEDDMPVWQRYLVTTERPSLRLSSRPWIPSIFMVGKKVDAIEHCQQELARLNISINDDQEKAETLSSLGSALVQFTTEQAAAVAEQAIGLRTHAIDVLQEIVWENIGMRWWTRYFRSLVIGGCILSFNAAWSLPIAFTGFLSQINYVATISPKSRGLTRLSAAFVGLFQGILPQLMLMLLTTVLPVVIRILVQRQGLLTQTTVERTIQRFYFASLFLQIFLAVSLSSSATTILGEMYHQVDSVPAILATNLPKSSNYFFSYILLQSLSISASQLVQITGLIKCLLLAPATDRTARDIWSRRHTVPVDMQWGTLFPVFTNLACIGSFCKPPTAKLGY